MHWKDKLGEAQKLFDEVKAIVSDEEASAEDKAKVQEMLDDARRLKAEAAQLKDITDLGAELEAQKEAGKQNEGHRDAQPGEFKEWSEFLESAFYAGHREAHLRKRDPRLVYFKEKPESGHEKKQMVEGIGASGGFLVPAEFLAQLQAVTTELAIVRPRATIIRMRRRQIDIPVLDQTGTTSN